MCDKTYQWSIFPNDSKGEQFVVREGNWNDFIKAIENVRGLIGGKVETHATSQPGEPEDISYEPVEEEQPATNTYCKIHGKDMKERWNKDHDRKWYDHRWKDGETWMKCNGKKTTES